MPWRDEWTLPLRRTWSGGIKTSPDGMTELIMDLEKHTCIFSAGLRVLLLAQKKMNKQGSIKVIHVNEMVMEAFVTMGFTGILTIT